MNFPAFYRRQSASFSDSIHLNTSAPNLLPRPFEFHRLREIDGIVHELGVNHANSPYVFAMKANVIS